MKTIHTTQPLVEALQQTRMRLTPQRIAICELLQTSRFHPTAADIHAELHQRYPSLSLMTVYNTLNALVGLGVVHALGSAGDDQVHFDANTAPHINLACIACSRIVDIDSPHVERMEAEVRAASDFQLLGARVMYYGLCPDCQKSTVQ